MTSLYDNNPKECSTNDEAAGALANGHPKAKPSPVTFGMRNRTKDGDGNDDDARSKAFGKV